MNRCGLALLLLCVAGATAEAQTLTNPNERVAPSRTNPEDKEGIWLLDFRWKDPRPITVDIPGRGKTTVWYLWYQVTNNTGAPRYFHPTFELVTLDRQQVTHGDEVLPAVEEAIRKQEDPHGALKLKNSVTIGKDPIPPSKPDALPSSVYGIAIWPDVAVRSGDTTRFSIFVGGLSNGWTIDDNCLVRRKTLQLNYKRNTDAKHQSGDELVFVGPSEFTYRSTSVKAPPTAKPVDPPRPGEETKNCESKPAEPDKP